jgi:hypothetical protein
MFNQCLVTSRTCYDGKCSTYFLYNKIKSEKLWMMSQKGFLKYLTKSV